MTGRFEVYEDKAGRHRFRLKADTGQIVAVGEAYETRDAAVMGCGEVKEAATGAPIIEVDDDGNEVTRSQGEPVPPPSRQTHTAVVRIPNPDSHESTASAAAHAALSLLTKVSAKTRGSVAIKTVTITTPETVDGSPDFASLLLGDRASKAVVVVAEANPEGKSS